MARITIEDCIEKVPNRFQLVRMASTRTKQLKKGARPLVTAEDNKAVVTSLREIAAGLVRPGEAEPETAPEPMAAGPAASALPSESERSSAGPTTEEAPSAGEAEAAGEPGAGAASAEDEASSAR